MHNRCPRSYLHMLINSVSGLSWTFLKLYHDCSLRFDSFSLPKMAACPHLDTTLHLSAPFSLSPRVPERDKAAATATATRSRRGSRNLLRERLVALPHLVNRARADDVGLVLQPDRRGRPAASLGDCSVRIRPVFPSNQTTCGMSAPMNSYLKPVTTFLDC